MIERDKYDWRIKNKNPDKILRIIKKMFYLFMRL